MFLSALCTVRSPVVDILYVGPVPPLRGGIAQHGAQLITALRSAGHRVSILTWASQYPSLLYKGPERDPAERFPADVSPSLKWYSPITWWRARRACQEVDLVVMQWAHPFHALPLRIVLGGAKRKSVVVVHNARPHERLPFSDGLTRFALRPAARLVAHSRGEAEAIGSILLRDDVSVTPHPPNLRPRPVESPPAPPWKLLFAGFVRPYKGLDIAIDSIAELRRRRVDVELTVAGAFWESPDQYLSRAASQGLEESIELRDEYVDDEALLHLMGSHHILLAPYRSATQSGLIPMALATGRPVAVTRVGGLPEQVPPNAGAVARPDDPGAFADAIEALLNQYDAACAAALELAPSWTETARVILDAPRRR